MYPHVRRNVSLLFSTGIFDVKIFVFLAYETLSILRLIESVNVESRGKTRSLERI